MTVTVPGEPASAIARPRTWRSVVLLSVLTVLAVAPFVTVLVPYYANDLDAVPLAELTSGAHDPKDLPGLAGLLGGHLLLLATVLALGITPMALVGLAAVSGTAAVQEWITFPAERRAPRTVAAALLALNLIVLALLGWLATPTAPALVTWLLD